MNAVRQWESAARLLATAEKELATVNARMASLSPSWAFSQRSDLRSIVSGLMLAAEELAQVEALCKAGEVAD